MTNLKQLFGRDIFGSSYRHIEIQRDVSSCWSALLAAGEAALRESGCTSATLWTEERNERARRVYEAAGWRPDGQVKERVWNGAPLTELRYRKAL